MNGAFPRLGSWTAVFDDQGTSTWKSEKTVHRAVRKIHHRDTESTEEHRVHMQGGPLVRPPAKAGHSEGSPTPQNSGSLDGRTTLQRADFARMGEPAPCIRQDQHRQRQARQYAKRTCGLRRTVDESPLSESVVLKPFGGRSPRGGRQETVILSVISSVLSVLSVPLWFIVFQIIANGSITSLFSSGKSPCWICLGQQYTRVICSGLVPPAARLPTSSFERLRL